VTPKKRVWNVQQTWERTEPREVLLDSFRRRKNEGGSLHDDVEATESTGRDEVEDRSTTPVSEGSPPETIPLNKSLESLPSITQRVEVEAIIAPNPLATSQLRMKSKPKDGFGFGFGAAGKGEKALVVEERRERERVVPLGEGGGNIPRRGGRR
jgi:kinesin family protein 11